MKTQEEFTGKGLQIILVGEGGQGIQTIAKIITRAAFEKKYHASYIPNFGTEQRGGLSLSFIQVSHSPIISPKFSAADIFVIVTDRHIERSLRYISPYTNVVYDQGLLSTQTVSKLKSKSSSIFAIDAFSQATTKLTERSFNVILLGLLTGLIDEELKSQTINVMDTKFSKYYVKNPELKKSNHVAFELGFKLTQPEP